MAPKMPIAIGARSALGQGVQPLFWLNLDRRLHHFLELDHLAPGIYMGDF
jgi:hypothetical protein